MRSWNLKFSAGVISVTHYVYIRCGLRICWGICRPVPPTHGIAACVYHCWSKAVLLLETRLHRWLHEELEKIMVHFQSQWMTYDNDASFVQKMLVLIYHSWAVTPPEESCHSAGGKVTFNASHLSVAPVMALQTWTKPVSQRLLILKNIKGLSVGVTHRCDLGISFATTWTYFMNMQEAYQQNPVSSLAQLEKKCFKNMFTSSAKSMSKTPRHCLQTKDEVINPRVGELLLSLSKS